MGTNFYGKKIPTQQELKSIAEMVLEGHIFAAKVQIESFEKIHIGKSSAGWRFCFNHQGEKWLDFADFKEFVSQFEIFDEYGSSYTQEEFWTLVEKKQEAPNFITKGAEPEWYKIVGEYEFSSSREFC